MCVCGVSVDVCMCVWGVSVGVCMCVWCLDVDVCMCVTCVCGHGTWSEDSLWELSLPVYHVGPGAGTQSALVVVVWLQYCLMLRGSLLTSPG
ncbi:hypothetical protein STEG23_032059 [Scotinomys teguina]